MRKFIHSEFEIDLSNLKITDTAENPWLTGNYFTKYSYPFDLPLTDENDQAFGFISHYNSSRAQTVFEGTYVHGNTMERAVLEIEECEKSLSATLRYGLEDFPNFTKQLSELPLEKKNVANIYTHAASVIAQTWPAVNYNFPQVHIDKHKSGGDDEWHVFGNIINNYSAGAFIINDVIDDISMNRNIIQPLPYALHILKAGVEDAGFTLKGDVLDDDIMKILTIYADTEYYKKREGEPLTIHVISQEVLPEEVFQDNNTYFFYLVRELLVPVAGKYRITGTLLLRARRPGQSSYLKVYYRQTLISSLPFTYEGVGPTQRDINIDFEFSTLNDLEPHLLTFQIMTGYGEDDIILQAEVEVIAYFDTAGMLLPSIVNENKVDLTRAVADKTFGDFVKVFLLGKRFGFEPKGKEIWMNYIDKEIAMTPVIDLSMHDVRYPKRKFNTGNSFLLKYNDVQSEEYKFAEVFQNRNGAVQSGYVRDEKTKEIALDALPLPLAVRDGLQTAHGFLEDKSKIMFVVYDGLTGGLNLSKDPSPWSIPSLHAIHHEAWMAARIDSTTFNWTLYSAYEQLLMLTAKSRIFAYGNNHLVKSYQKTEIAPELFEVEIETEVIK